jgi:hypothetical protein
MSNLGRTLSSKYRAAVEGVQKTSVAFHDVDNAIKPVLRNAWLDHEKDALKFRGERLRIYDIQTKKSMLWPSVNSTKAESLYLKPLLSQRSDWFCPLMRGPLGYLLE